MNKKPSRIYDWRGIILDLSKIIYISHITREDGSGKYMYRVMTTSNQEPSWWRRHTSEEDAIKDKDKLVQAWKDYWDYMDGTSVEIMENLRKDVDLSKEDIIIDPIESLEPK